MTPPAGEKEAPDRVFLPLKEWSRRYGSCTARMNMLYSLIRISLINIGERFYTIQFDGYEIVDSKYCIYHISVLSSSQKWRVSHRFSAFDKLLQEYCICKTRDSNEQMLIHLMVLGFLLLCQRPSYPAW